MPTVLRHVRPLSVLALSLGVSLAPAVVSAQTPPAAPPAAAPPPVRSAAPAAPAAGAPAAGAPSAVPPSPAAPAPAPLSETLSGMAKAEYEAGRILYGDGDFASALVKFERAHELSKDGRLLWNIAVCEKNLRRYAKVLHTLDAYLAIAPELLTEQDRADAGQLREAVLAFVSKVTIEVNEPGADVFVDGVRVGTSPLPEPVLVDVGTRSFRVSKPGFVPFEESRSIAGADAVVVAATIALEVHEGKLVVEAGPNDVIFIDGKRMAMRRWEGVLPSGPHTLRVSATGKLAYQTEVVIQDGQERRIPVSLEAAGSGGVSPWVFIVSGGVLLAAGAVTAGVLLSQPGDPATTAGTIQPGTIQLSLGQLSLGQLSRGPLGLGGAR